MAKTTFKSLLRDAIEQVKASTVPIKAVEYDPTTRRFRVEFNQEAPAAAPSAPISLPGSVAEQIQESAIKYVPGTRIPDDDSPLDPLEIVSSSPRYALPADEAA